MMPKVYTVYSPSFWRGEVITEQRYNFIFQRTFFRMNLINIGIKMDLLSLFEALPG